MQLRVEGAVEPDADAAELEEATAQLRGELLELDVMDVRRPPGAPAPPGARAANVTLLGTLVVATALDVPQWVEVLQHWGYAESFLIQVPTYASGNTARVRLAQRDLDKASAALVDGRYRDAVGACRDALEVAYGEQDSNLFAELEYHVTNLKTADKAARFWLVRRALWAVTHASKHSDETTQAFEWTRRDAVAAIAILAALIQQEPPAA